MNSTNALTKLVREPGDAPVPVDVAPLQVAATQDELALLQHTSGKLLQALDRAQETIDGLNEARAALQQRADAGDAKVADLNAKVRRLHHAQSAQAVRLVKWQLGAVGAAVAAVGLALCVI